MQGVTVAACSYEILAITTGKVPTVSRLCRRSRWLEALFLGWLFWHFHKEEGT